MYGCLYLQLTKKATENVRKQLTRWKINSKDATGKSHVCACLRIEAHFISPFNFENSNRDYRWSHPHFGIREK